MLDTFVLSSVWQHIWLRSLWNFWRIDETQETMVTRAKIGYNRTIYDMYALHLRILCVPCILIVSFSHLIWIKKIIENKSESICSMSTAIQQCQTAIVGLPESNMLPLSPFVSTRCNAVGFGGLRPYKPLRTFCWWHAGCVIYWQCVRLVLKTGNNCV